MLKKKIWFITDYLIKHTPPCDVMTRIISDELERKLTLKERLSMKLHFLICIWCDRYRKQLRMMRYFLREGNPSDDTLSNESKERMKKRLKEES